LLRSSNMWIGGWIETRPITALEFGRRSVDRHLLSRVCCFQEVPLSLFLAVHHVV
jgi:hypothetical protein